MCTTSVQFMMSKSNKKLRFMFSIWFQLFETSARDETECDNVDAIFLTLAHKLKNHRPMMPPPMFPVSDHGSNVGLHRADVLSITREPPPSGVGSSSDASCWC
jgi:Ras-related protein Rab-33B